MYTPEAITSTSYKYTDRFYVHQQVSPDNEKLVNAILEAKNDSILVSADIMKSFCNYLIDQQVRVLVNRDFAHILDLSIENQ